MISPSLPEIWIIELAQKWFTEYLAEAERQHGYDPHYFPALKSFIRANDFDGYWPEDNLPALLVMGSGLADKPHRYGDGNYSVKWMYGCSIICSTPTRHDTREAQHIYATAFTEMMVQHRSLEHPDVVSGVEWVDGRPAPMPPDGDRMLGAANMFFTVQLEGVANERGTPPLTDPRDDPYETPDDLGVVGEDKATATIIKKGIE